MPLPFFRLDVALGPPPIMEQHDEMVPAGLNESVEPLDYEEFVLQQQRLGHQGHSGSNHGRSGH